MKESWHLRKEVSIGTIITVVVMAIGGVFSYASLKASVEHKADSDSVVELRTNQKNLEKDIQELKDGQRRILDKLDEIDRSN